MKLPHIPGYTVEDQIGTGGMALVFKAHQHNFDRQVALKVLSTNLVSDSDFCERFLREARIVAKLRHEHIVPVYDVGDHEDQHYIAMEFIAGGDLTAKLKEGEFDEKSAVTIIEQIASALEYAHSKNVIHRDIKPDNIMFRANGSAVLADFGIAKDHESILNLTRAGDVAGTPTYMSPEQIMGGDIGPAADYYSLGIMFFYMLTGEKPYTGSNFAAISYQHINEPVPRMKPEFAHFQPVIDKLLAKSADERYQTGTAIIDDIAKAYRARQASLDETIVVSALEPGRAVDQGGAGIGAEAREQQPSAEGVPFNKAIFAGVAAIAMVGAAYFFWPVESTEKSTSLQAAVSEPSRPVATPVNVQDEVTKRQVIELLALAETDLSQQRLRKPAGNNAYEKYQRVLELDPGNDAAENGIRKIAAAYVELANSAINRKNASQAQSYILQAQELDPDSAAIEFTQKNLDELNDAKVNSKKAINSLKEELRIAGLMRGAERDEKEGRLFSPEGNNAAEKYREVLRIAPGHKQAKERLSRL